MATLSTRGIFFRTQKIGVMTRSRRRRHGQQAREPSGGQLIRPVIDGRFHELFLAPLSPSEKELTIKRK
jgi:hypothetical protein